MSIEDVLIHYGFRPQGRVVPDLAVAEWAHPTATNLHQRACTVLQFGNRAIVHSGVSLVAFPACQQLRHNQDVVQGITFPVMVPSGSTSWHLQ